MGVAHSETLSIRNSCDETFLCCSLIFLNLRLDVLDNEIEEYCFRKEEVKTDPFGCNNCTTVWRLIVFRFSIWILVLCSLKLIYFHFGVIKGKIPEL